MIQALTGFLERRLGLGPNSLKVILAFSLRGAAAVLGFALSWTLAQSYGAYGLGLYSVAVTTAVFCSSLALCGQENVILRTLAGELRVDNPGAGLAVVRRSVAIVLVTGVLGSLAVGCGAWLLKGSVLSADQATMLIVIAPAVLALVLARTAAPSLRAAGNILVSQSIEGVTTPAFILSVLLVCALLHVSLEREMLALLFVLASFGGVALGWITFRSIAATWPRGQSQPWRPLLLAGIPMLISTVSNASAEWAAIFATSAFADSAAAGQLRVALQMVLVVTLVVAAFDSILGPQIAAAWKVGDHATLRRVYRKAAIGATLAASPILLAELLFPVQLMRFFGADFVEGANALRVLAAAQFFVAAGPIGTVLIMSGHDRWLVGYSLASMVVVAALCLLVVPIWGVTGGAVVIAGNLIFRRTVASLILRYVVGLKLTVWRKT